MSCPITEYIQKCFDDEDKFYQNLDSETIDIYNILDIKQRNYEEPENLDSTFNKYLYFVNSSPLNEERIQTIRSNRIKLNKLYKFKYNYIISKLNNDYPFIMNLVNNYPLIIAGGSISRINRGMMSSNNDIDLFIVSKERYFNSNSMIINIINETKQYFSTPIKLVYTENAITFIIYEDQELDDVELKFQIILRKYDTISQVLHSFDIGSSMVAYDGKQFYFTGFGKFAMEYNYNVINMKKRSMTYELRLAKYFNSMKFGIIIWGISFKKDFIKLGDKNTMNFSYLTFKNCEVYNNRVPTKYVKHKVTIKKNNESNDLYSNKELISYENIAKFILNEIEFCRVNMIQFLNYSNIFKDYDVLNWNIIDINMKDLVKTINDRIVIKSIINYRNTQKKDTFSSKKKDEFKSEFTKYYEEDDSDLDDKCSCCTEDSNKNMKDKIDITKEIEIFEKSIKDSNIKTWRSIHEKNTVVSNILYATGSSDNLYYTNDHDKKFAIKINELKSINIHKLIAEGFEVIPINSKNYSENSFKKNIITLEEWIGI